MSTGFCVILTFTQCPDSGVKPGKWVRSVLQGFHWHAFVHSDPTQEQTPQAGQIERAQVRNDLATHGKVPYIAGADPAFCLHTQKKPGVRPRMRGRTLQIWRSTKGGSDPTIRAGDLHLHWGAKGGVWPRIRLRNRSTV